VWPGRTSSTPSREGGFYRPFDPQNDGHPFDGRPEMISLGVSGCLGAGRSKERCETLTTRPQESATAEVLFGLCPALPLFWIGLCGYGAFHLDTLLVTPKFSCRRSYKGDPYSNVRHVKIPNSRHFPFCLKTPNGTIRKRAPFRGVALQCCPSAVQADKLRQLFMKQRLAV